MKRAAVNRSCKSLFMLWVFVLGHLLPTTLYANPTVVTDITVHAQSAGTQVQQNGQTYDVTTTQTYNNTGINHFNTYNVGCLLYTSPSPRDGATSRMPSSA